MSYQLWVSAHRLTEMELDRKKAMQPRAIKPRIISFIYNKPGYYRLWVCMSSRTTAFGVSPQDAYVLWSRLEQEPRRPEKPMSLAMSESVQATSAY